MSRRAAKTMSRRSGAAGAAALAPEDRYINREELRAVIPASDMTIWRWQRDSEIAFPVPVKLGDNGRNYWWLPDVRAWMRRREERQPQAVRHLVIRGNGGSSNNTDLPAGTSASAAPAVQKTRPIGRCSSRSPRIGHHSGRPMTRKLEGALGRPDDD